MIVNASNRVQSDTYILQIIIQQESVEDQKEDFLYHEWYLTLIDHLETRLLVNKQDRGRQHKATNKVKIFLQTKEFFLFFLFLFTYLFCKHKYKFTKTSIQIQVIILNKNVCRQPVENQNMFCHQAPLNIDIMSVIKF